MKLRQLRYVTAIADHGLNITTAADRLCTTQPGISKQLKLLEEELGFEIFVRKGRSLTRITPVGREIIGHARVILREVEAIHSLCRSYADEPQRDGGQELFAVRHDEGIGSRRRGERWNP